MADGTLAQRVRTKYPGVYDDLDDATLEAKVTAKFPGVYDDIPRSATAPAAPERPGLAARAGSQAMRRFAQAGRQLNLGAVTLPAAVVDIAHGLFSGQLETGARDYAFKRFVDPASEAVEFWTPPPAETTGEKLADVGGQLGADLPMIIGTGGRGLAVAPEATAAEGARQAAVHGMKSMAAPAVITGGERQAELMQRGAPAGPAAVAGATTGLTTALSGAVPLSTPSRLLGRMATGAAAGAVVTAAQREAENLALHEYPEFQQPLTAEELTIGALPSAALAAILGPRAGVRPSPRPTADVGAAPDAQFQADFEAYRPILEANQILGADDPRAQAAVAALNQRAARAAERRSTAATEQQPPTPAEQTPWARGPAESMVVDQQGRAMPGRQEGARIVPEGVRAGTPEAGTLAGELAAGGTRARAQKMAGEGFAQAEAQRVRKQEAQDRSAIREEGGQQVDPRDLRDAGPAGTTTREGTAAITPESFTFYRARIEGGRMTAGERVEVRRSGLELDGIGGEKIPASVVRFLDREGQPEMPVPDASLKTLERPAQPRFAQAVEGDLKIREAAALQAKTAADRAVALRGRAAKESDPIKRESMLRQAAKLDEKARKIQKGERVPNVYAPPRGVGTGEQQPAPRAAAQRITTEPSPEVALGARPQPRGQMEGRTETTPARALEQPRAALPAPKDTVPVAERPESPGSGRGRPIQQGETDAAQARQDQGSPQQGRGRHDAQLRQGREDRQREAEGKAPRPEGGERGRVPEGKGGRVLDETSDRTQARERSNNEAEVAPGAARESMDGEAEALAIEMDAAAKGGLKFSTIRRLRARRKALGQRMTEGGEEMGEAAGERLSESADRLERAWEAEQTGGRPETKPAEGETKAPEGEKGSGGTLYGGFPVDKMAEAVADAWGWTRDSASAYARHVSDFWASVGEAAKGDIGKKGSPALNFARMVFDDATGHIRSVLTPYKSKTANSIVDMLADNPGVRDNAIGQTLMDAVEAKSHEYWRRLNGAIGDLDDATMKQLANLVRNPGGIRSGTKLGQAAADVGKLLKDVLAYMREADVELGEVPKGYYPREYDRIAVLSDPQGFINGAAREFELAGLPKDKARESAAALADDIVHGGSELFFHRAGQSAAPFLQGRSFRKEVDLPSHPLNKFLVNDPRVSLSRYIAAAARRAETARRFGDSFSHWHSGWTDKAGKKHDSLVKQMTDEGATGALDDLRRFVAVAAGIRTNTGATFARLGSWVRTYTVLRLLEKATIASLHEFVSPAIRSGNAADVLRSLKGTTAALLRTRKGAQLRAIAEDLGLISDGIGQEIQLARWAGGDLTSQLQAKITDKFFRRTFLHQLTEGQIAGGSVNIGRVFIRRMAKLALDEDRIAIEALTELGIPKANAKSFAEALLKVRDGLPIAGEIKQDGWGAYYRTAMRRFSKQSIMQPEDADRPRWMSTDLGRVAGQIQSFNYAFWKNILKRTARMTGDAADWRNDYTAIERMRLLGPLSVMPILLGVSAGVGAIRDKIWGDPNRRKEESALQKAIKIASRAVPVAPIDPWLNYAIGGRYTAQAVDKLVGPGIGGIAEGLDSARDLAFNNIPETNAAERRAAKAFYDLVLEPGFNVAAGGFQHGPISTAATAAGTQVVGAGGTREAFVSGLAGEKGERASGASKINRSLGTRPPGADGNRKARKQINRSLGTPVP